MYYYVEKMYSHLSLNNLLTFSIFLFFMFNIVACSLPQPKPVDIDLSSHHKKISKDEKIKKLVSVTVDFVEVNNNDVFKFPFYEGSSFDDIDGYIKEGNNVIIYSRAFSAPIASTVRNLIIVDLDTTSKTVFMVWKRKVPITNKTNYKIGINVKNMKIWAGCSKNSANVLMDKWIDEDREGIEFEKRRLVRFFKTKDKSKFVEFLSTYKAVYPNVNIKYKCME